MEDSTNNLQTFFVIIQPGLEEILASEIQQKYPALNDYKILTGGVEVVCTPEVGYSFNKYLKTPTRVLLRLKEFSCRDLPKLFQRTSKIPWNLYLVNGKCELDVSCSGSLINNEKRVQKAVEDGIETYLKGYQPKQLDYNYAHRVFVRIHNDQCQISMDTSGEALYKRTNKKTGPASLRESIAGALLRVLLQNQKTPFTLADPMCGSGTFAGEALGWNEYRNQYAYQKFASVQKTTDKEPVVEVLSLPIESVHCNDMDATAVSIAKENLSDYKNIEFSNLDMKDFLTKIDTTNTVVVCNPPYGKRLDSSNKELQAWVEVIQRFKTWGVLVPKAFIIANASYVEFRNGGLPVRFYYKL